MENKAVGPPPDRPAGTGSRGTLIVICGLLAVAVFLVFGQTLRYDFVNYDDGPYVYENTHVVKGLTLKGVAWAFTHVECNFYHPLTMLSLMLDYQLHGLHAGGYHLTNVLIHTASAVLLFLILRRMTGLCSNKSIGATTPQAGLRQDKAASSPQAGALWPSAFVAAVFAIHPLRVESVAWVAERKDVLSGFFFMLTLLMYARYVEESKVRCLKSKVFYGLALLFFALGLMSKPTLVTVPFVLLLLDYWPLGRTRWVNPVLGENSKKSPGQLLKEKLPFFALAVVSCVVTYWAQCGGETVVSLENLPPEMRIANGLLSYVCYIGKAFWPTGLAVFYPLPVRLPVAAAMAAGIGLLGITAVVIWRARREPWLATGWLWYLGMLVPMIGIIQVGGFAHADRFTYLPMIGLSVALTWAAADLCAGWRHRRVVLGGCSTVILVALIFCARTQASYWRNSESLLTHTLACTSDNSIGHYNLGNALFQKGDVDEAITQYQKALQINPDYMEAHYNLGCALIQKGRMDEAIIQYQKALQINPDNAEVHYNLGCALLQKGRMDEAITQYQKVLQIEPDNAEAQNKLAWVLATCPQASLRNGDKAVALAQRTNQLTGGGNPVALGTLAAAYAEAGRFPEAVETAQRALQLAETQSNTALADAIRSQLKSYQAGIPFHLH